MHSGAVVQDKVGSLEISGVNGEPNTSSVTVSVRDSVGPSSVKKGAALAPALSRPLTSDASSLSVGFVSGSAIEGPLNAAGPEEEEVHVAPLGLPRAQESNCLGNCVRI